MKQILARIKPYLRWFILGRVLFFLIQTIKDRFAEITAVSIDHRGYVILAIALLITIIAHIWSGWVWTWILRIFKQPLGTFEGIKVYLLTNIAKYSPGNIWHFYGRISAVGKKGGSRKEGRAVSRMHKVLADERYLSKDFFARREKCLQKGIISCVFRVSCGKRAKIYCIPCARSFKSFSLLIR